MKYIDADRLCAEIEKIYKSEIQPWLSGVSPKSVIYEYVLPLIDSLQKEQPEADLEKEIERWWGEKYMKNAEGLPILPVVQGIARHFAEWQSKQDKETIELAEDHAYLAGSVNEREKMMKEAVEGVITNAGGEFGYDVAAFRFDDNHTYSVFLPHEEKRKYGDKVRIIIVKED